MENYHEYLNSIFFNRLNRRKKTAKLEFYVNDNDGKQHGEPDKNQFPDALFGI